MNVRIPLAKPEITDSDRTAVMEVLRTSSLSMGPKLLEFEGDICDFTGSKYAIAVNSGTSALQLAIRALGLERGAEVILPSFTFSALLNVVLEEGLRPKFVDIAEVSFNTTPELISRAITPETRLIIAVHTFGFPADMAAIRSLANRDTSRSRGQRHTVYVVEDACEAIGAEAKGSKAGSLGDVGLFAFYPNKQITAGEGGVLVTCNERIARKARQLRNQGRDPSLGWLDHAQVGFSYRLSEMNCALGISQLRRIEAVIESRQRLATLYDRALAQVDAVRLPAPHSSVGRISWFIYPIMLAPELTREDRDQICDSLSKKGIGSGRYFAPLHRQPVLASAGFPVPSLPNTDAVADRVIALPFFNEITAEQVQEVCDALEESIRELRR